MNVNSSAAFSKKLYAYKLRVIMPEIPPMGTFGYPTPQMRLRVRCNNKIAQRGLPHKIFLAAFKQVAEHISNSINLAEICQFKALRSLCTGFIHKAI